MYLAIEVFVRLEGLSNARDPTRLMKQLIPLSKALCYPYRAHLSEGCRVTGNILERMEKKCSTNSLFHGAPYQAPKSVVSFTKRLTSNLGCVSAGISRGSQNSGLKGSHESAGIEALLATTTLDREAAAFDPTISAVLVLKERSGRWTDAPA